MIVRFKLLSPTALAPSYMRPGDAGADLFADEDVVVYAGGLLCPMPVLARQHGVTVLNAPSLVHSGCLDGIEVLLVNHGARQHAVLRGDRVAQLLVWPSIHVEFVEVDDNNAEPADDKCTGWYDDGVMPTRCTASGGCQRTGCVDSPPGAW